MRGEGGRGLQVRAGSAREVRDRVRGWDKESSRCWGSLGGGERDEGRGRGGRPPPWGPGISRVSPHRWAEARVEGRRASSRGRLEPVARESLDGVRRGLACGQSRHLPRRALDPRSLPSIDWEGTGRPSGSRINISERARTPVPCLGAHLPTHAAEHPPCSRPAPFSGQGRGRCCSSGRLIQLTNSRQDRCAIPRCLP